MSRSLYERPKDTQPRLVFQATRLGSGLGARADVLEHITRKSKGDVIDMYTTLPWELLCEAVSCIQLELGRGVLIALPRTVAIASGDERPGGAVQPPPKPLAESPPQGTRQGTRLN